MAKRKSLSKRTRFEVFKRDGFRCRYCGADPVKTVLNVDHLVPVAGGGTNEPDNLITSCRECNSGKSNVPLESRRYAPTADAATVREHTEQLKEYLALQKSLATARRELAEVMGDEWTARIGPISQDMFARLQSLMREWPSEKLIEAMEITGRRRGTVGEKFVDYVAKNQAMYFHGVLRKWKEAASALGR